MSVKEFYLLPCGKVTLDRSILMTATDMGVKVKAPVIAVLIIHEEGPVLLDVGLNPDGLKDPETAWGPRAKVIKPELTESDDIRNRLKELNLKVTDIKKVFVTHFHWDHTGGLRFFTHCPIILQRAELRFAFNPDTHVTAQYMRNHFDFPLNFQPVDGDRMILPGISVIKTPGHTPGHQSLLIKLSSGRYYIFPGDALPIQENLTQKILSSNNWNNEQALDSLYRLEHLSQLLGADIIHSHDLKQWDTLKKSPYAYQ